MTLCMDAPRPEESASGKSVSLVQFMKCNNHAKNLNSGDKEIEVAPSSWRSQSICCHRQKLGKEKLPKELIQKELPCNSS